MKIQIKVTPHDIENRIQTTEQPNGEKFVADWTWEFQKKIGYHGSPMGRGHTGEAAIADLIRRTNMELGSCELIFSNIPIESQAVDYFTAPMHEGDFVVLAQLLVRYHNSITEETSSLYGAKMDKALCRDAFGTLYRRGPYAALQELQSKFNVAR